MAVRNSRVQIMAHRLQIKCMLTRSPQLLCFYHTRTGGGSVTMFAWQTQATNAHFWSWELRGYAQIRLGRLRLPLVAAGRMSPRIRCWKVKSKGIPAAWKVLENRPTFLKPPFSLCETGGNLNIFLASCENATDLKMWHVGEINYWEKFLLFSSVSCISPLCIWFKFLMYNSSL